MKAILNVADTGPLESLVIMLRSVGYDCHVPDAALSRELNRIGCNMSLTIDNLVRGMGYERPMSLPEAHPSEMDNCDVFVDVKAHQNYDRITHRWSWMKGKVLWYRINGGKPEIVPGRGDELNPPCPILTPNQWYSQQCDCGADRTGPSAEVHDTTCPAGLAWTETGVDRFYSCWPPFYRFDEYFPVHGRVPNQYSPPVCLIHNVNGWGYRAIVERMREMKVKCYGAGSPDGLINHKHIPDMLSSARCMVHLKSSDAPGYAIYEALAAACPVICTRRLIWRCKMQDLLIPGETCLVFDRETHEGLNEEDVEECCEEVGEYIRILGDPVLNRRIGMQGRERLKEVMWAETPEDMLDLSEFMNRNF